MCVLALISRSMCHNSSSEQRHLYIRKHICIKKVDADEGRGHLAQGTSTTDATIAGVHRFIPCISKIVELPHICKANAPFPPLLAGAGPSWLLKRKVGARCILANGSQHELGCNLQVAEGGQDGEGNKGCIAAGQEKIWIMLQEEQHCGRGRRCGRCRWLGREVVVTAALAVAALSFEDRARDVHITQGFARLKEARVAACSWRRRQRRCLRVRWRR